MALCRMPLTDKIRSAIQSHSQRSTLQPVNNSSGPDSPQQSSHAIASMPTQSIVTNTSPYPYYPTAFYPGAPYTLQQALQPSALFHNNVTVPPQPQQTTPQSQHAQPQQAYQPSSSMSPSVSRKRRASEIDDPTMSSSLSMSPYMMQHAAMMAPHTQADLVAPGVSMIAPPPPNRVDTNIMPAQISSTESANSRKGRTNTPWTPQEEQRLKIMKEASHSWSEIAKSFPLRTEGSVKKHWYKDMHFTEFAVDDQSFVCLCILDQVAVY